MEVLLLLFFLGGSNDEMVYRCTQKVCSFYMFATLLPYLAVTVRRLHDVGKSGWWILISLVPFIGLIWLLVLLCTDSQPGENKYGPNPKEIKFE
ncbi:MAG: DUF805 domain-containing protein [Caldimicrobium sp.]